MEEHCGDTVTHTAMIQLQVWHKNDSYRYPKADADKVCSFELKGYTVSDAKWQATYTSPHLPHFHTHSIPHCLHFVPVCPNTVPLQTVQSVLCIN